MFSVAVSRMKRHTVLMAAVAYALMANSVSARSSIGVRDAWSRPAVDTAVVYATIENSSARPDRLIAASCGIAKRVEFHESSASTMLTDTMAGMPMHGSMMSMKALAIITIPANGRRVLAPGGYHLMLVGLRRALAAGMQVPLRLQFAHGGWVAVVARVRDQT